MFYCNAIISVRQSFSGIPESDRERYPRLRFSQDNLHYENFAWVSCLIMLEGPKTLGSLSTFMNRHMFRSKCAVIISKNLRSSPLYVCYILHHAKDKYVIKPNCLYYYLILIFYSSSLFFSTKLLAWFLFYSPRWWKKRKMNSVRS